MAKVGSKDVARLAGVSRSTVSRVFTPGTYVAEETRLNVMRAADMLGYRPNIIARSLTTQRTGLVGIVAGDLENPLHSALVRRIASGVQDRGMASLLVAAHYNEVERVIQTLMSYQIDALVVTSAVPTATIALECERAGILLVVANQGYDSRVGIAICGDNRAGAKLVAEHLIEEGWTRFAFIAGLEEVPASVEREDAFVVSLARHGHALMGRGRGNYSSEDAASAMRVLLSSSERPDAVFCASDEMAVAAVDVARLDFGLKLGRDIAVAGYGDGPLAALRSYELTSVNPCIGKIAAAAVDVAVRSRDEAAPVSRILTVPPQLVVRASTRRGPDERQS